PAGVALAVRAFPAGPAPRVARNALTSASRPVQRDDHARNGRGPLGQNRGEMIPAAAPSTDARPGQPHLSRIATRFEAALRQGPSGPWPLARRAAPARQG